VPRVNNLPAEHLRFDMRDAVYAAAGAVVVFFLASVMLSGWPGGLTPNFSYPYVYAGDGLFQLWLIERVMEGWSFTNSREGFPFGSPSFDFPGSDAGNLLISKVLGKLSGSYYAASNAYVLLGFSATFAASYLVLRRMAIRREIALAASLLFAFLPYHFFRLLMGHAFYTWYFVIPVYFHLGYRLFNAAPGDLKYPRVLKYCASAFVASWFGVYFALFGAFTGMVCGLAGSARRRAWRPTLVAIAVGASITAGVLVNVAPNLAYALKHGKNPEVAQRSPVATEILSLKVMHLVIPHQLHRIEPVRDFAQRYASSFPLSNTVSYVGLVGLFGLVLLGTAFVRAMAGQPIDQRMALLVLLTGTSLMVITVGGLNVLFAMFISPMIRGWDRFSIFIAFYAIAAAALWADSRWPRAGAAPVALTALVAITALGLADQTIKSETLVALSNKEVFFQDRSFAGAVESALPRGAAIYQLPYTAFPESANLQSLGTYDHLAGYLNSKELRWSSGGMQGREADRFYRALAQRPLTEQVTIVKSLGFAGIWVDRRGYADNGASVIEELSRIVGAPPILAREDGTIVFFRMPN